MATNAKSRVVVTGASGFIGSFLVEALRERGDVVDGWTRGTVDVTDPARVAAAMRSFEPDAIVHLAAQSLPTRSWDEPAETYTVNVGGTINVLEAARGMRKPPRVLLAGTSAEYAEPPDGTPIAEDAPIAPNSPYAASKAAVTVLGELYSKRYGLDIVVFRPFGLIGPRKTGDASSDFVRRIVAIERGKARAMTVGDVTVVRDVIDVRDGVTGMIRLIERGAAGEVYNICAGHGVSIGELLTKLRALAEVPIEIETDPALLRPLEQKVKIGNPSKLRELGWAPIHPLEQTLADILAYWRAHER